MRPQTPDFDFSQPSGPSSPPETPTSPTFQFGRGRRHGMQSFPHITRTLDDNIRANGDGHHFSYNRFARLEELSPRSSSPSNNSSESGSPPRSLSSGRSASAEVGEPERASPPPTLTTKANFTLEEIEEDDYSDLGGDEDDVIRPYHYEDAESDNARSYKGPTEIDARVISGLQELDCSDQEQDSDRDEHLEWLVRRREEKRRKRRSSGSVKRTISQSIGSGTDEEDMIAPQLDATEAGSSARRLRRKMDRTSLIFDDPPPRIEELEEPESCEEIVEIHDDDTQEGQGVDRNLPYYIQEMDVDSSEE
ncbi:hypothetical protein PVAG01_08145 [Phlyctema vagabunda]|uniref:Uncharacterized protein n=1 Tax=Phlyctema vagabunda TaxID=108571 RepID=A0ABR4P8Z6_9HELO